MTKDWNFHKKKIIKLYKTEGMTLEQVREYMIREWNFKAGYASPTTISPFSFLLLRSSHSYVCNTNLHKKAWIN